MVNKDYILRLAERIGRELAIILGLRQRNKLEDALIYIDDLFVQATGLTTHFINSLSDDMLVNTFSPMGKLNVESCLWIAMLLKSEGEVYEQMDQHKESFYRYLKSLRLLLEVLLHEPLDSDTGFFQATEELLSKLADYELPVTIKNKLLTYYEHIGQYGKAENTLFEMLEDTPGHALIEQSIDFYNRLLQKSETDLQLGNLPRAEVEEGLAQVQQIHA